MNKFPLDYSSPNVTAVSDVRFRPAAALLIVANLLAGAAAGLVGIVYADRLGGVSAMLLAAALLTAITVFGFLARQRPRFGIAAICTILATAGSASGFVLAEAAYGEISASILRNATSPVVIVYIKSEEGALMATLDIARYVSGTLAALNATLLIYLAVRYMQLRNLMVQAPRVKLDDVA